MEFTIRFEEPMDDLSAGALGLWLDMLIREADEDYGPFQISYRASEAHRR